MHAHPPSTPSFIKPLNIGIEREYELTALNLFPESSVLKNLKNKQTCMTQSFVGGKISQVLAESCVK